MCYNGANKTWEKNRGVFLNSSPCQVRSHNLLGLKQSQQIHLGKIIWERILPFTLLFCFAFLEEHKSISSTNLCSITDRTENNIAKHLTTENLNYFTVWGINYHTVIAEMTTVDVLLSTNSSHVSIKVFLSCSSTSPPVISILDLKSSRNWISSKPTLLHSF